MKEARAMRTHDFTHEAARSGAPGRDHDRERRLELLVRRLPPRLRTAIRWLRRPSARWVRIPAGLLLVVCSLFSILPILGLWMLPLGLVLLAEDVKPLRRGMDGVLAWIERRRPHWMGLSEASGSRSTSSRANSSREGTP
jgi:hypothetical protein